MVPVGTVALLAERPLEAGRVVLAPGAPVMIVVLVVTAMVAPADLAQRDPVKFVRRIAILKAIVVLADHLTTATTAARVGLTPTVTSVAPGLRLANGTSVGPPAPTPTAVTGVHVRPMETATTVGVRDHSVTTAAHGPPAATVMSAAPGLRLVAAMIAEFVKVSPVEMTVAQPARTPVVTVAPVATAGLAASLTIADLVHGPRVASSQMSVVVTTIAPVATLGTLHGVRAKVDALRLAAMIVAVRRGLAVVMAAVVRALLTETVLSDLLRPKSRSDWTPSASRSPAVGVG